MRLSVFLWLLGAFAPGGAFGAEISLQDALERAARDNAELAAQRRQETQMVWERRRVNGEFGPRFEGLVGVGPITRATGNVMTSVEDKHSFGRIWIGRFQLTQPLYAWGRSDNYRNAARAGLEVKRAETRAKQDEIRFAVKEAYYGYQLANSLLDFIQGGRAELEKALQQRKAKKKDAAKDDYRLEIFLSEVSSRQAEVTKYFHLAQEGFALRLGAARGAVVPKDKWLLPAARTKQSVELYVAQAQQSRPELEQVAEGIFAKRSLAKAERKGVLPVLALLASYELADTNVRPHQPGVFAYDPYNRESWTVGVGLKMDFQWGLYEAKAGKHLAEAQELEAKEAYALRGIETEVRKAYLELEEAEQRLEAATQAYKTGKKWLTGEVMAFSSGLGSATGLTEAYGARAETAKNYFEAVYRHHMAWAGLSKAVGREVDPAL